MRTRGSWSARSTSTRAPAGSRISSASSPRSAPGRAPARTTTSAWRRARATDGGWRRSPSLAGWVESEGARALVVALGVDAAGADPESPLEVSEAGSGRGRGAGQPRAAHRRRPGGGYDLGLARPSGGRDAGRDRGGARLAADRPVAGAVAPQSSTATTAWVRYG